MTITNQIALTEAVSSNTNANGASQEASLCHSPTILLSLKDDLESADSLEVENILEVDYIPKADNIPKVDNINESLCSAPINRGGTISDYLYKPSLYHFIKPLQELVSQDDYGCHIVCNTLEELSCSKDAATALLRDGARERARRAY